MPTIEVWLLSILLKRVCNWKKIQNNKRLIVKLKYKWIEHFKLIASLHSYIRIVENWNKLETIIMHAQDLILWLYSVSDLEIFYSFGSKIRIFIYFDEIFRNSFMNEIDLTSM
jgi:hypothetical protein